MENASYYFCRCMLEKTPSWNKTQSLGCTFCLHIYTHCVVAVTVDTWTPHTGYRLPGSIASCAAACACMHGGSQHNIWKIKAECAIETPLKSSSPVSCTTSPKGELWKRHHSGIFSSQIPWDRTADETQWYAIVFSWQWLGYYFMNIRSDSVLILW